MKKFTNLKSVAAPLPMIIVDTDMILPKQYLRVVTRDGLGKHLFEEIRFNPNGSEKPDFVLNREPYRNAQILIAGENFGCGSSREHAPWALLDFGISCVIAPFFADIFYNNCFKNGILPVVLPKDQVEALMKDAESNPGDLLDIDLVKQTVARGNRFAFSFDIAPYRKHALLNGLDDIGLSLEKEALIGSYEDRVKQEKPWL